jgi:uncharacterized protein YggE
MKALLLIVLSPLVIFCQSKDISYLVVKGRAEVQVPVEFLEIGMLITTNGPSLKTANDSNRVLVFKIFDVLRGFGIPDSDFQTTNNSSQDEEGYNRSPERRFSIRYSGILNLRNPSSYDSLFQALISHGNVTVNINAFRSNRHAYYRMLAYQKAVEAARHEAQLLLKGSHQTVGKIIKLIQDNRDIFTQYDDLDKLFEGNSGLPLSSELMLAAQRSGPSTNTFRKKYFSEFAEVTVIFDIK